MHFRSLPRLIGSLLAIFAIGCAPAYHDYTGCRVDCRYCVPPPLPYAHYPDCVCHACAVRPYLADPPHLDDEEGAEINNTREASEQAQGTRSGAPVRYPSPSF